MSQSGCQETWRYPDTCYPLIPAHLIKAWADINISSQVSGQFFILRMSRVGNGYRDKSQL